MPGTNMSTEERVKILTLLEEKVPLSEIVRRTGRGIATIHRLKAAVCHLPPTQLPTRKPRSGRPRKTTKATDTLMKHEVLKNPHVSAAELKKSHPDILGNITERTIQYRLQKELQLPDHHLAHKPLLTKKIHKQWQAFAKKYDGQKSKLSPGLSNQPEIQLTKVKDEHDENEGGLHNCLDMTGNEVVPSFISYEEKEKNGGNSYSSSNQIEEIDPVNHASAIFIKEEQMETEDIIVKAEPFEEFQCKSEGNEASMSTGITNAERLEEGSGVHSIVPHQRFRPSKSDRANSSGVYHHYDKPEYSDSSYKAKCKYCAAFISGTGKTTSNLLKHISAHQILKKRSAEKSDSVSCRLRHSPNLNSNSSDLIASEKIPASASLRCQHPKRAHDKRVHSSVSFYTASARPTRIVDVLEAAESNQNHPNTTHYGIYVSPPENATENITDEDSEEGDCSTMNNLPGSMLRAALLLDDLDSVVNDETIKNPLRKKKKTANEPPRCWKRRDIRPDFQSWAGVDHTVESHTTKKLNPIELFELFLCEETCNLTVKETNRYAAQKNVNLDVTNDEIKCVIGILLLSGYSSYPRRQMFWENSSDTYHELVANSIRRDRFEAIFTHLHFADNNNLDTSDKFSKLRPLINKMNKNFLMHAPTEEYYNFDESICEYFGRHGCKQFICSNPVRFGFKLWCGTTTQGYLTWFEPCQGKSNNSKNNLSLGIGGNLMLKFVNILQNKEKQPYHLCFDNLLGSVKLMSVLKNKGVKATGTVRENRIERCPLMEAKELKKMIRGSYDFRVDEKDEILVCRWHDDNVVSLCSNAVGIEPVKQVIRYSSEKKQKYQIMQPLIVKLYNEKMGGVDRMNQNVSKYRVGIKGKKWYSALVTYVLDVAMNNAWLLYKMYDRNGFLDLLGFRRTVVRFYLERYACLPCQGKRDRPSQIVEENRYDKVSHWVIPQEKQTRCAHCHNKTTTRCEKCQKGLHVKCFKAYHTE